jgi:hypothetical protein
MPLRAVLTICREHDAEDVYVTGTFDDWQKTVQLEKEGSVFKKSVELPKTKTQYKVRPLCDTRLPPGAPARPSGRQLPVQTPANRGA